MAHNMAQSEPKNVGSSLMQPTLSVIMPNYNHAQYISEALNAILAQSYTPLEIIIIDDASTDNSFEILEDYASKYSLIRLLRNEHNLGVVHNIIRLNELVKGDYLYVAAADDKILPGFFEKSMNLLTQYPQAGLCSTCTLYIDEGGRNRGILHMPVFSNKGCFIPPDKALSMLHRYGSWIQGNTTILRRRALIDSGGFIPELQAGSDSFAYQVIAVKSGVCFIPEVLAACRQLDSSYSATIAKDPELCLRFIRHAKMLMSTTYRDLFPSDFVDLWEKRVIINNRLACCLKLQNAMIKDLLILMPSQGLMDKFIFGLRRFFTKTEYIILKSYLYHRAGLSSKQLFIQRLKRLLGAISKRLSI